MLFNVYLFFITFLGFVIQSIAGFGSAIFAMPLAMIFVSKSYVLPVFCILSLLQSVSIAIQDRRFLNVGGFLRMLVLALLGCALGFVIGNRISENVLNIALALFIIVNSSFNIYGILKKRNSEKKIYKTDQKPKLVTFEYSYENPGFIMLMKRKFFNIYAILSGFLQATYGMGGPFIAAYMNRLDLDKRSYRVQISAYWAIINPLIVLSLAFSKLINIEHIKLTGILIPAMALGILSGNIIINKISITQFKIFVNIILLFVAITLFI